MDFLFNKKLKKFRLKGIKVSSKKLYFGFYGLKSLETGRINSKVLVSFKNILQRQIKIKKGKLWVTINDSIPVTKIPIATRMGKGKGNFFQKVAFVRKGQILCEVSLSNPRDALAILKLAAAKMPVKTRIVSY